jgi:hypothetical protein
MSDKIGGHSVSHLLSVAKDVVEKKTKDSVVLDENMEKKIPKFSAAGPSFVHQFPIGSFVDEMK